MREVFNNVEEIFEYLGLGDTTLEKLAKSFCGFKYVVEPNKEDPQVGSIRFECEGYYNLVKEEEVLKKAGEFYNKEKYIPLFFQRKNGFELTIMNNTFRNIH